MTKDELDKLEALRKLWEGRGSVTYPEALERHNDYNAALRSAAPDLIAAAKALAKAQAKADECEVDWEVWNTENTRLQSALAAAQSRIAELVADLATAEARISELVEGLRPFADSYERMTPDQKGRERMHYLGAMADFRRAARLLTELTTSHPTQSPTKRESS